MGSRDDKTTATEEERLGLVKGDSTNLLPIPSNDSNPREDWGLPRSSSPGYEDERVRPTPLQGLRRVDTEEGSLGDDKEFEKGRRAFL
jgi:hypothetical protein